jgi:hypothetical protein
MPGEAPIPVKLLTCSPVDFRQDIP